MVTLLGAVIWDPSIGNKSHQLALFDGVAGVPRDAGSACSNDTLR